MRHTPAEGEPYSRFSDLALCGHRGCPTCAPMDQRERAGELARALYTLTVEGWEVGMATLTLPHRLDTHPETLVGALKAGLRAVSQTLKPYRTPEAEAAAKQIRTLARRPGGLTPEHKAALRQTVIDGSLCWLAPPPEVTLGDNGLHPHYHLLLLCPPALTGAEWWQQRETVKAESGKKSDEYTHNLALEAALASWTTSTIEALNRGEKNRALEADVRWAASGDPSAPQPETSEAVGGCVPQSRRRSPTHFGGPLQSLHLTAEAAGRRLHNLLADPDANPRNIALARADFGAACKALAPGSAAARVASRSSVQVVHWKGPVGALARYTWGAASEISDAGKRNNIWRALDSDFTAPLWGRWQIAAERVRLSRSTSGLIDYIAEAAERAPADIGGDAAQAAAALPARQEVVAEVHPAVVQWARDNHKEAAFLEAATRGPDSLLVYLSKNLPPALVDLVCVRPELPDPSEDDGEQLSKIRHDLACKGLGFGGGYWIGPDGYPVCGPYRPPASREAKVRARTVQIAEAALATPKTRAKAVRGIPAATVQTISEREWVACAYEAARAAAQMEMI